MPRRPGRPVPGQEEPAYRQSQAQIVRERAGFAAVSNRIRPSRPARRSGHRHAGSPPSPRSHSHRQAPDGCRQAAAGSPTLRSPRQVPQAPRRPASPDGRPVLLGRAPGHASPSGTGPAAGASRTVVIGQQHPPVIPRHTSGYSPRVDQPPDDEPEQRRSRLWLFGRRGDSGMPVVERREHHPAAQASARVADSQHANAERNGHRWAGRPRVVEGEAMLRRQECRRAVFGHGVSMARRSGWPTEQRSTGAVFR